jgi:hypothetical protein
MTLRAFWLDRGRKHHERTHAMPRTGFNIVLAASFSPPLLPFAADLGGPATGRPGAVRNPDGRLEVFARRPDGGVFHTWQRNPGGEWDRAEFGGRVTGDIAADVWLTSSTAARPGPRE